MPKKFLSKRTRRNKKFRNKRRTKRVYRMRGGWGGAITTPYMPPSVMKGGWGGIPTNTV